VAGLHTSAIGWGTTGFVLCLGPVLVFYVAPASLRPLSLTSRRVFCYSPPPLPCAASMRPCRTPCPYPVFARTTRLWCMSGGHWWLRLRKRTGWRMNLRTPTTRATSGCARTPTEQPRYVSRHHVAVACGAMQHLHVHTVPVDSRHARYASGCVARTITWEASITYKSRTLFSV
jgi:hypothetical protein